MKQIYPITSNFGARPFVCHFPHNDTKEYIQTSLLLLQENENTQIVFEDQNGNKEII